MTWQLPAPSHSPLCEYDSYQCDSISDHTSPPASETNSLELDACFSCAKNPSHIDFLKSNHEDSCCISGRYNLTSHALVTHEALSLFEQGHLTWEEMLYHRQILFDFWSFRNQPGRTSTFRDQTIHTHHSGTQDLCQLSDIIDSPGQSEIAPMEANFTFLSRNRSSKLTKTSLDHKRGDDDYAQLSRQGHYSTGNSSASSARSWNSSVSRSSRKGRRIVAQQQRPGSAVDEPSSISNSYQCTFCSKYLTSKYAWRRHEESIHAPQHIWICGQLGNPCENGDSDLSRCPFCVSEGISPRRVQSCLSHNTLECWRQPFDKRAFFRKDAILQHIERFHRCSQAFKTNVNRWIRPVQGANYDLKCHFCGLLCQSWDDRIDHVGAHFENGANMTDWTVT